MFALCGCSVVFFVFFFFNDTATTEIYTLSLHDALPICAADLHDWRTRADDLIRGHKEDRKSTRLNSSHANISYAVFCLKKKKQNKRRHFSQKKNKKNNTTQQPTRTH